MQLVRSNAVSRLFALVTSFVFLNMSMILMEVNALRLDRDRAVVENVAKQIAGCMSEEESDAMTSHSDDDTSLKEIDLIATNLLSILVSELSDSKQLKRLENLGTPRYGNYEIFCPPPEA
jgi:hypothetical protein